MPTNSIGFFVDYTTGVATKDKAKQDKAVADLVGYSNDFAAFLNSSSATVGRKAEGISGSFAFSILSADGIGCRG